MKVKSVLTDEKAVSIGKLYGSPDVKLEASEVSARWHRDEGPLAAYGHGPAAHAKFEALRERQAALLVARPGAVADKQSTVKGRLQVNGRAWRWVDQVDSTLTQAARDSESLALALRQALPANDGELAVGIGALVQLIGKHRGLLPEDAQVDERLAEAPALVASVTAAPGQVATAKSSTVQDTAAVDLADGRLQVVMRDFNEAGRRAIRNGDLKASLKEYRFHHLRQANDVRVDEPAPTPVPAVDPTKDPKDPAK